MSKTLLIIGGGAEQVPAYLAAKARGLTVVGSDVREDAPALTHADHRLIASTRDPMATLAAVQGFIAKGQRIDGVMTIANDVPTTVAVVADALGLPGLPLAAARAVSHKLLMKQAFVAHGVPCPWFSHVQDTTHLKTVLETSPHDRWVLKPVDGRGARGVLLIDRQTDLDWAFAESRRWGDSGELILEAFIPGLQLSTESYVIDGRAHTPAIAERNYDHLERFAPYIIENGGTIPALLSAALRRRIDEVIVAGAASLGAREGIVKGDLIVTPEGEVVIVELALRLSGGWFATHQIPAASGVDLVAAAMRHALGEPVLAEQLQATRKRATAIRYWFPPEGKILFIGGEEQLRQLPGLISHGFFRRVGEYQPAIRMHPDRFGFLIVEADTRDTVLQRVQQGLDLVQIGICPEGSV